MMSVLIGSRLWSMQPAACSQPLAANGKPGAVSGVLAKVQVLG